MSLARYRRFKIEARRRGLFGRTRYVLLGLKTSRAVWDVPETLQTWHRVEVFETEKEARLRLIEIENSHVGSILDRAVNKHEILLQLLKLHRSGRDFVEVETIEGRTYRLPVHQGWK